MKLDVIKIVEIIKLAKLASEDPDLQREDIHGYLEKIKELIKHLES